MNKHYNKSLSIVIPAYNEGYRLKETIAAIIFMLDNDQDMPGADAQHTEIIIIDDGSTDSTPGLLHELAYEFKGIIKPVFCNKNCGKGAAVAMGLDMASKDLILVMDADMQVHFREYKTFRKLMHLYNADVVVGNKRHPYSIVHYSGLRWFISNGYYLLVNMLFDIPLRDTQCGFKLFRRDAIYGITDEINVKRFAFDIELLCKLRNRGLRIIDAPVYMDAPPGPGSVSAKNIIQTFIDTLAVWRDLKRKDRKI